MSDDELKLNRRRFLQHTAVATAASATWHSVAMKTDALAEQAAESAPRGDDNTIIPYQYSTP